MGSTNPFKEMTYGETVAACAAMGLELCDQSCEGEGCSYNLYPVYSRLPCPFARPTPELSIPESGIAILKGNAENETLACLWPGDEDVTSTIGRNVSQQLRFTDIAAQCCASNQPGDPKDACRRKATADGSESTSNEDCIAGWFRSSPNPFKEMTDGETVAACAAMGLELCDQSCDGEGCSYNVYPVYSGLPCPSADSLLAGMPQGSTRKRFTAVARSRDRALFHESSPLVHVLPSTVSFLMPCHFLRIPTTASSVACDSARTVSLG